MLPQEVVIIPNLSIILTLGSRYVFIGVNVAVFDIQFGFDKACTTGEGSECNRSIFGEQACKIESSYAEYWINS